MNTAFHMGQPLAGIGYPNIAGTHTSTCSEPTRRFIELGPFEALLERTGTGPTGGTNGWLLSGFSMTSPCSFRFAETPADLPVARKSPDPFDTSPQSPSDQLRLVQTALGLSLSHLAAVLKVERQTIYNWMRAEQPRALQARTRARLAEIVEVSRKWRQRCSRPVGKLAATLDLGSGTLLDLLMQTSLDNVALESAMDVLAEYIEHARARRYRRIGGLEPPPETSDDRILRAATGIPLNSEPDED